MSEIEKALVELKDLMKFRSQELGREEEFRALGLTSRKNLCLHPSVKREKDGNVVDARCRNLTARFVKDRKEKGEDVELCEYHEVGTVGVDWLDANLVEPRKAGAARSNTSWCVDS
jgi:DNA excision repair protein ERCC-2